MICIEMRGSRGAAVIAACVVLGVAALGVPGAAWSASPHPRQRQVNTEVVGPLTVAWSGDRARGCQAEGLCGVSGTLQMQFGGSEASSSGGPPELTADDDAAVARVQTTAPDGSVTTCADLIPIQVDLAVHGGRARLSGGFPGAGVGGEAPSAGRCAGPTSGDLAALTLPARRLAHGYNFSGGVSFTTGPFVVTVISGVRARVTYGGNGGGGGIISSGSTSGAVKARSVLMEHASVTYRVLGFSGALTTDFAGLAPPACDALGACGTTGRLVQSLAARGKLQFTGTRIARRIAGRDRALADLRRGAMAPSDTFAEQAVHETVAETSILTGDVPCAATSSILLAGGPASTPRHAGDVLMLSDTLDDFGDGPPDEFRTRCPGPSAQDIVGPNGGALATATVSSGQLGDRRLAITFHSAGTFHGSAYAGRRSGAVVLALALVRSTGGTRRVSLFPGEPLIP
jgi:hypothetical protein